MSSGRLAAPPRPAWPWTLTDPKTPCCRPAAGRTAPGDPASTSRRPRHRRLLESADAAGALASGRAGGAGGRRSSLLPPQLIADSLASLNASAMLLEPKVGGLVGCGSCSSLGLLQPRTAAWKPVLCKPDVCSQAHQPPRVCVPNSKPFQVDVVLSQGALQDRHEQYACGGSPALPLRLSDEALVILRHLRQLERLPAQVR